MTLKHPFRRDKKPVRRPRSNSRNTRKASKRGGFRFARPEIPATVRSRWEDLRYWVSWSVRMVVRTLPYALIALILALTPVAVVYGYRYVTATPDFRVQNVHIEGHSHLSVEELLDTARVSHAPNILKLDLSEVEAALLAHPWIISASVRRELPAQLYIKVVERVPVALLALDGPLYLVDKHANIFTRTGSGEHFDLPILTGLTRDDLAAEAPVDRKALTRSLVRGALKLMDVWRSSDIGQRIHVSEIHMDPLLGLSLVLGEGAGLHRGAMVRVGRGLLQEKLDRLEAIVDHAAAEGRGISRIMLDNSTDPSRVAVSFRTLNTSETTEENTASSLGADDKTGNRSLTVREPGGRTRTVGRSH